MAMMKGNVMKKTSTGNAAMAFAISSLTWLSCQAEPPKAIADNQPINTFKVIEQKPIVKASNNRLQFDKQAHVHRLTLHSKQDLTLDQGF